MSISASSGACRKSGANGEDADTILERVIPELRPGDILAHPFTRHPGGFVNREGQVHEVIQAALDRGLKVDVGHGSHFSYRLARKAIDAGIVPDTLGADMHGYNTYVPPPPGTPAEHPDDETHPFAGQAKFSLTQAMSSMLALGLTLEQVVPMVTTNAAAMIGTVRRTRHAEARRDRRRLGARRTSAAASSCATTRRPRSSRSACCSRSSACGPASATMPTADHPAGSGGGLARRAAFFRMNF